MGFGVRLSTPATVSSRRSYSKPGVRRHFTTLSASSPLNDSSIKIDSEMSQLDPSFDHQESILDNIGPLLELTRPKNFPGVVLFHMTGIYLALSSSSLAGTSINYWMLLCKSPGLWGTLFALLLVDSTSMVVNDYYDAKLGRDETRDDRALVAGRVSFDTTKRFVSYLYAAALILAAFLPGAVTRLSVIMGLILTYLYTQYMKPVTWLKNLVCASLIALSPWSSGSAALHVALQVDRASWTQLAISSLWRLVGALFCGVMAREILMDCNDVENDRRAGVRTVPIVHGRRYASRVAFAGTCGMTLLTLAGPIQQVCRGVVATNVALRRLMLGAAACGLSLFRGWRVVQTEAKDAVMVKRTVDEELLSVLLVLASFL